MAAEGKAAQSLVILQFGPFGSLPRLERNLSMKRVRFP
jgi:hypothetical protein